MVSQGYAMFDIRLPVESAVNKEPQPPDRFGLNIKYSSNVLPLQLPSLSLFLGWTLGVTGTTAFATPCPNA